MELSSRRIGYIIKKRERERGGIDKQDGGIDKHSSPPCTNTTKLQLNYRTIITQNCQKIELYGSGTTKELKKPHSPRWIGGGKGWRLGKLEAQNRPVPHPCVVGKN